MKTKMKLIGALGVVYLPLVLLCDISIAGKKLPPSSLIAKRLGSSTFGSKTLREAKMRFIKPKVLEVKESRREVFKYDFAEPANLVTKEKIFQIIDRNYKPVSLADIKHKFSNSSYEEVSLLIKELVKQGELIIISVSLSAFENFNMFTTLAKYETQTDVIVDYIRTRPNFTEAELMERFPVFFDYWVISSIVTDLIDKKFIQPSEERAGAWEWNYGSGSEPRPI